MRILMPVDNSVQSKAAVDFVAGRTPLTGQTPRVRLLNVQPTMSPRIASTLGARQVREYQREEADQVLRPALARLKKAGIVARADRALGHRADTIAAAVARSRPDMIVMGSRRRSALKGALFGSMTHAVLESSSEPLLVLGSRKLPAKDSLAVGIAVDGSGRSLTAVRWALENRDLFGAEPKFHVIHVLPEVDPALIPGMAYRTQVADAVRDGQLETAFDRVIAPVLELFSKAGLEPVTVQRRSNDPGDAIAAEATKRRLDVLVLGSRGHGAAKSLILGSVATRVAAKSNKPVLFVREPSDAAPVESGNLESDLVGS